MAESIALVDGDRARAVALLDRAVELPHGFAGFQAPASLGLAESYWVCGAPPGKIDSARQSALAAADRIQDPVFCVRTLSRCVAITKKLWGHVPAFSDPVSFVDLVRRFIESAVSRVRGGPHRRLGLPRAQIHPLDPAPGEFGRRTAFGTWRRN
jgi:hypothetical protein